jgi:hypothetical protein
VVKSIPVLVEKVINMNKAVKAERKLNKIERSDVWHSSDPMVGESHEVHEMAKHKAKSKHHSKKKKESPKQKKMHKVMHEFKHGELHSGSKKGPKVTGRKQAVAIAMSEARKVGKRRKSKRMAQNY